MYHLCMPLFFLGMPAGSLLSALGDLTTQAARSLELPALLVSSGFWASLGSLETTFAFISRYSARWVVSSTSALHAQRETLFAVWFQSSPFAKVWRVRPTVSVWWGMGQPCVTASWATENRATLAKVRNFSVTLNAPVWKKSYCTGICRGVWLLWTRCLFHCRGLRTNFFRNPLKIRD